MTFFEKLAESIGIKEAIRLMYHGCPCDYFMGLGEFCPEQHYCPSCWCESWEGHKFKNAVEKTVIYPGDIVAVETPGGFKIGRVMVLKEASKYTDVWIDKTNIPAAVEKKYIHKIVNAYLITDDLIGGTDEEVEEGMKDACEV